MLQLHNCVHYNYHSTMEMESQSELFLVFDYDMMAFEATAPLVETIIQPHNKLTLHYKPSKKH